MNDINATTAEDVLYSSVKAALSSIPLLGSAASELFGLVITPPLDKRRAEWMNEIAERLKALEAEGRVNFDSLADDAKFLDTVIQATALAIKTSQDEKVKAYRNAVLNTATGDAPDIVKAQMFLNLLDNFTSWHIVILKFIDDPIEWFKKAGKQPPNMTMGSLQYVFSVAFPELKNEGETVVVIWEDLKNAGFHNTTGMQTTMTGGGLLASRTTNLAKEFLSFII